MEAAHKKEAGKTTTFSDYDYSNFYYGSGDDPLNLLGPFSEWYSEALPNGYYLYSEPLQTAPTTVVLVRNRKSGEVLELLMAEGAGREEHDLGDHAGKYRGRHRAHPDKGLGLLVEAARHHDPEHAPQIAGQETHQDQHQIGPQLARRHRFAPRRR